MQNVASVLKYHGKMWYNFAVPPFAVPNFAPAKSPTPRYQQFKPVSTVVVGRHDQSLVTPFAATRATGHFSGNQERTRTFKNFSKTMVWMPWLMWVGWQIREYSR